MLQVGSLSQREQHLLAVAHVEALFADDATKNPPIRAVGAFLEDGLLRGERGSIDEECDDDLVGPGFGLVVEHVVEAGAAVDEIVEHLRPGLHSQIGGDHIEKMGVADLVLGLRKERQLAVKPRRPGDPVALA